MAVMALLIKQTESVSLHQYIRDTKNGAAYLLARAEAKRGKRLCIRRGGLCIAGNHRIKGVATTA